MPGRPKTRLRNLQKALTKQADYYTKQIETVSIPYEPRREQEEIHRKMKRFSIVVTHRRLGKTVMAVNQLIASALMCTRPNPRFAYMAPLYSMAKSIAWTYLQQYGKFIPGAKFNETELRVDFPSNGSQVRLFGTDHPDTLRGLYFDGVWMDEAPMMAARLYPEVVRPALMDRHGWVCFTGTPQGRNWFYELYLEKQQDPEWYVVTKKASETGILSETELGEARRIMDRETYAQEMECSFTSGIKGAYFARQLEVAETEGRIRDCPVDPLLPVVTAWDLGVGDATAIWFAQPFQQEIRLVRYYEVSGEGLPTHAAELSVWQREKKVGIDRFIGPHDLAVRDFSTGVSRYEIALRLGLQFEVLPKLRLEDGIEAVRGILDRCIFDREACRYGIEHLRAYRRKRSGDGTLMNVPEHGPESHAADAFRYLALGLGQYRRSQKRRKLEWDQRSVV